jgi:FkbM family methyltransferase
MEDRPPLATLSTKRDIQILRFSLLYNPFDLIERLALASRRRRRFSRLRGTPAAALALGHIDSLELLELLAPDPPKVIYDIGANVGTWTCLAKSLFPTARVEAFEPLTSHFEGFRRWTAPWPHGVRLHACALGPVAGSATMHVMNFSDASSLLEPTAAGLDEFKIKPAVTQPVSVVTLDAVATKVQLPLPDLIKLDVQGYELEVLRGGQECLRHSRAVLTEVSFKAFYVGQPLFHDVVAFLAGRGFVLHALGEGTALGAPLIQTDALFLRSS